MCEDSISKTPTTDPNAATAATGTEPKVAAKPDKVQAASADDLQTDLDRSDNMVSEGGPIS
jgi:hypothetical protein